MIPTSHRRKGRAGRRAAREHRLRAAEHGFGLAGRALDAIGEIVHDIDCQDERYGRPETAGIATLIRGVVAAHADDRARR